MKWYICSVHVKKLRYPNKLEEESTTHHSETYVEAHAIWSMSMFVTYDTFTIYNLQIWGYVKAHPRLSIVTSLFVYALLVFFSFMFWRLRVISLRPVSAAKPLTWRTDFTLPRHSFSRQGTHIFKTHLMRIGVLCW